LFLDKNGLISTIWSICKVCIVKLYGNLKLQNIRTVSLVSKNVNFAYSKLLNSTAEWGSI